MSIFSGKNLRKYISTLAVIIHLLFIPNIVLAGSFENTRNTYLSPSLKIGIPNFIQLFQEICAQDSDSLFKLTRRTFDKLTPVSLQSQIMQVIRDDLLKDEAIRSVQDIKVRFTSSSDEYLNYCRKEKLKELIFDDKGMIYRAEYQGMRKERKRKWIIEKVCSIFDKNKEYYRSMPERNLWGMYYQYLAEREFRRKLLDKETGIEWIDFDVTVKLKDRTLKDVIKIEKKNGIFKAGLVQHKLAKELRQKIHVLESQRDDFRTITQNIERLERVINVNFNKWQDGVSRDNLKAARQTLGDIYTWTKRGRVAGKLSVEQYLKRILKKDGYLDTGDYQNAIKQIDQANSQLDSRLKQIAGKIERNIKQHSAELFQNLEEELYFEILKSSLICVESLVRFNRLEDALSKFEFIVLSIKSSKIIQNRTDEYTYLQKRLYDTYGLLDSASKHQAYTKALDLIKEVDARIQRQNENISEIWKWLKQRKFNQFARTIGDIIPEFYNIRRQRRVYTEVISSAIGEINGVISACDKSEKINPKIKNIIKQRLAGVRNELISIEKRAQERNDVIRKALPQIKIVSLPQTELLLKGRRKQAVEHISLEYDNIHSGIFDNLALLHLDFTNLQLGNKLADSGLVPLKNILPAVLDGLFAAGLIAQAI